MTTRKYKPEWALLLMALISVIASIIGDFFTVSYHWFSRSGSIIILLAVIVEYRISAHIYDDIQMAQFLQGKIELPIPFKAKPNKQRRCLSISAHTTIVLGTVICGYGDLVWS